MTNKSFTKPVILYGSNISYFTGKMENYFRVKNIPYLLRSMQFPAFEKLMKNKVGLQQMPAVELPDGRWITDSTKMIQWFESQQSENKLTPKDPIQAFICFLLEDWADEWWWRSAMHYRWYYSEGAEFASRHLAVELLGSVPAPIWIKKLVLKRRQRAGYTAGDGMTRHNIESVEANFKTLLNNLERIFTNRPFIFGDRPSIADIGLSGPFFRHFALDPVPLEIIRQEAPAVLSWVSRLWNTRIEYCSGSWLEGIPDDLEPLLDEIGNTYLPYLCANIDAVNSNKKHFDVDVGGMLFKGARYSQYRVWCVSELRAHYQALPDQSKRTTRKILEKHGCWEPLWRHEKLPLLNNQEVGLPFKADTKMVGVN
jgi:glutathione S-transferase